MRGPPAIQVVYKLQFWKQAGIAAFQPHSCFWWLLSWLPVLFNKITFLFSPLIFSMAEQNLRLTRGKAGAGAGGRGAGGEEASFEQKCQFAVMWSTCEVAGSLA